MVYRPTVRYPDMYKEYVEDVFKATSLDRNQIIRLALFVAGHSNEYKKILEKYRFADVPLPQPQWTCTDDRCWKDQNYVEKEKTSITSDRRIVNQGGIIIKFG